MRKKPHFLNQAAPWVLPEQFLRCQVEATNTGKGQKPISRALV